MYMVSSFRKREFCRSLCEMNIGQPDAIFISVVGRLKLELAGSGRNVSERSRRAGDWSSRLNVTFLNNVLTTIFNKETQSLDIF